MFAVIYRFEVKENCDQKFIHAWSEMTKLIYKYEGSLGSRLHHQEKNIYIAYAQWPNREKWETFGNKLPLVAKTHSLNMRDACIQSETIYKLEMLEDYLAQDTNSLI
ncbi:MAG: antibiotic biosynthesis monooxygenase [Bacteroidetes bacterium]|nr:MAG: antibiotic biosynthesis monooxygenase [Bacteroidota bacterium]MBL1144122.1 antibiotic biosynthesis monooxygenase [Bacteroidota bacterium]NOG56917.1 antibiotic biosynthesis monooxygenase [Bacteroidota bacterium]